MPHPAVDVGLIKPTRINGLFLVTLEEGESFLCGTLVYNKGGVARSIRRRSTGIAPPPAGGYEEDPIQRIQIPPDILDGLFENSRKKAEIVFKLPGQLPGTGIKRSSAPDAFFYVNEVAKEIAITQENPIHGGDFLSFFQPFRVVVAEKEGENDFPTVASLKNSYGIVVNGNDFPLMISRKVVPDPSLIDKAYPLLTPFIPHNAAVGKEEKNFSLDNWGKYVNGNPTGGPLGLDFIPTFAIASARHITQYQGQIVYGGFHSYNPKKNDGVRQNFSHWIAFSSPLGTKFSCYEVNVDATLQIGDSISEPVTAVAVNSVETDSMGNKGQLLVFTAKKITFFDGIPPAPGTPLDASFRSDGSSPFGCAAPNSIVRTPYGMVYLGIDGIVRIIPFRGHPVEIGRAIEPALTRVTPMQQSFAAAVYHKGYYILSTVNSGYSYNNNVQWWADLRGFGTGSRDAGVRWFGPMTNQYISVFAREQRSGLPARVFGGSSVDGQIFEVFKENVSTDPMVRPIGPGQAGLRSDRVPILVQAESGPLDFGNAHTDKVISAIKMGVGTDDGVTIDLGISTESVNTKDGKIETLRENFVEDVDGPGYSGVKIFNFAPGGPVDRFITTARESFELVRKYLGKRLRGRTFTLHFRERPKDVRLKDPKVFFSDLSVWLREITKKR